MKPIGIYLHIPFCDGKCHYCNFYSMKADEKTLSAYTEQLIRIIKKYGDASAIAADTVYFGGGTPSILGADRLLAILNTVFDSFAVADDAEITVEANPLSGGTLDFQRLRKGGFNRLSIGVQSGSDKELRALGRRHSREDSIYTVKAAQNAGFENISLDLMLAIPYQTSASLSESVRFCAELGVQHISAYMLKIEEGTAFFHRRRELPLFDEDREAQFYEQAVKELKAYSYKQYEISNFSRDGFQSRHNLHYWHDDEYLGIGPSAHGYIHGERYYYANSLDDFYADRRLYESKGGDRSEYLMLALRLCEGVRFSEYEKRFGSPLPSSVVEKAAQLMQKDLMTVSDDRIAITPKGFLVSNAIIAYLTENL